MQHRRTAAALLLGAALQFPCSSETLRIVTPGRDHPVAEAALRALPPAYGRIGFEIEFVEAPPLRAIELFVSGAVDGFVFSDDSFADHYPAVRVDEPLGYDEQIAFAARPDIRVDGWESLRPYRIGYMHGMKIVEERIAGMRIDPAMSPDLVMLKLERGRTDVAVLPRGLGEMYIRELDLEGIRALEPPLARIPLYHFLNPKRASLARPLAEAIRKLAAEGLIGASR